MTLLSRFIWNFLINLYIFHYIFLIWLLNLHYKALRLSLTLRNTVFLPYVVLYLFILVFVELWKYYWFFILNDRMVSIRCHMQLRFDRSAVVKDRYWVYCEFVWREVYLFIVLNWESSFLSGDLFYKYLRRDRLVWIFHLLIMKRYVPFNMNVLFPLFWLKILLTWCKRTKLMLGLFTEGESWRNRLFDRIVVSLYYFLLDHVLPLGWNDVIRHILLVFPRLAFLNLIMLILSGLTLNRILICLDWGHLHFDCLSFILFYFWNICLLLIRFW